MSVFKFVPKKKIKTNGDKAWLDSGCHVTMNIEKTMKNMETQTNYNLQNNFKQARNDCMGRTKAI